MSPTRKLKVSLEGNIGAGKSSFIRYLQSLGEISVVPEQVTSWQNVGGFNLLESALRGDRTSLANFQHYALHTVMAANVDADSDNATMTVTDRSLYTQKRVFWEAHRANRLLSCETYATLDKIFGSIVDGGLYTPPDIFIYLKLDPAECLRRCRSRDRPEERNYSLDYFRQLEKNHERWLAPSAHVWVLDCNGKTVSDMQKEAAHIWSKMKQTQWLREISGECESYDDSDEADDSDVASRSA